MDQTDCICCRWSETEYYISIARSRERAIWHGTNSMGLSESATVFVEAPTEPDVPLPLVTS